MSNSSKLERYFRFLPKQLKPQVNPILRSLIEAWAGEDAEIEQQLKNTNAQLFVKTAEGVYLDRLASNFGVSRPAELGMIDDDFRELIPNLSLKAKQISQSFYNTMDVFWGPQFSRANITGTLTAPFNVGVGESFSISVDGKAFVTVTTKIGDFAVPGAATSKEILRVFGLIDGITAEVILDPAGNERINLRTNTPGARGSIEIDPAASFPGLGFLTGKKVRITDLAQRTVLYQVNPGEVIIELPAVVPTLRRSLRGSHHFHADSTLEAPVPPGNGVWQGSFFYSQTIQPFVVTSVKAELMTQVLKGSISTEITVDDASLFPVSGGKLVFNYGKANEEQPIDFITVPNDNTILIDPAHIFAFNHEVGSSINVLLEGQTTPYAPRRDGTDLAIYLTSPGNARGVVQEILETLVAAGVTVKFLVLLPEYRYIFDNPYDL